MQDIIAKLTAKDDKYACAIADKIVSESQDIDSLKESIKNCTAKVYVFVGGKENSAMQKSAQIIHQALQLSVLQVLPDLYHGGFSINKGMDYANKIREIKNNIYRSFGFYYIGMDCNKSNLWY